jgi:CheY-like chemotaxis protein
MIRILITISLVFLFFYFLNLLFKIKSNKIKEKTTQFIEIKSSAPLQNINQNNKPSTHKKSSIMDQELSIQEETEQPINVWTESKSYVQDVIQVEKTIKEQIKPKTQPPQNLIFIVDDSLVMRTYTERLLATNNYNVNTFNNGEELLTHLENMANKLPQVIIIDLEMPIMNGFETITKIRDNNNFKKVKILVVSGHIEENMSLIQNEKINGLIEKPFVNNEFLSKLDQLLK